MICLTLFWNFLMIGTLSFGGGYGMISLVREVVLGHGWLTESEFLSFIAVSESTPGPLAVNMATFIGSSQAGLPGALVATLGVVLPSFVIILLVAAVLRSVLRYAGVQAVLDGVRPCVVAMILATAVTMGLSTLGGYTAGPAGGFAPDGRAIAVFVLLGLVHCGYKKNTAESTIPHWDDPAFCRTGHRVLALRRAQPSGCCFSSCRMSLMDIPAFFMQPITRSHSMSLSRNWRMPPDDRATKGSRPSLS